MGTDTFRHESSLFAFEMVSANGFFQGPDADISWHNVDGEYNRFVVELLEASGTLIFGRVTYELLANYWPTVTETDPVAERMNAMEKVVVSTTLESAKWDNTWVVSENVFESLRELKQSADEDIAVLGSSELTRSLLTAGLLDELRIMVNPVLLSDGVPLVAGVSEEVALTHRSTRTFESGNVLLSYKPRYE